MASSVSEQDELNPVLWLASQVCNMRWSYLAHLGLPAASQKKKIPWRPYNKSFINQACSVKMAGCCPVFFAIYGRRLCLSPETLQKPG